MKKIILNFADLWLKKLNKINFINSLKLNVYRALSDFNLNIKLNYDYLEIFNFDEVQLNKIINILKFIPGISNIIIAHISNSNIHDIYREIINNKMISENTKDFKLVINRVDKTFYLNSEQIINELAALLLNKFSNLKVNVHNPETFINIKIKKECSIIFTNKIKGLQGLPIGLNGSCLSLISGGIDSPISSFLLQTKGLKVDYLTFITSEVTESTINKIKNLINQITLNKRIYIPKLYIVDFTSIQQELAHSKSENYRIALMRRSFYRIAEKIALKYKYDSLCSGDSLGQVASQTIESLNIINDLKLSINIFRPLLIFPKQAIINIAKKINTYNISIQNHEDICSLFAPSNPITKPNVEKINRIEDELDLLKMLEESVFNKVEIVEF